MKKEFITLLSITILGLPILAAAEVFPFPGEVVVEENPVSIFSTTYEGRLDAAILNGLRARPDYSPVSYRDNLFNIMAWGFQGEEFKNSALIGFEATEDFSADATGTCIRFVTTQNGTNTSRERMRIDHNGNIGIGTRNPVSKVEIASEFERSGLAALTISSYYDTGPIHPAHIYGQKARGSIIDPSPVLDGDNIFMLGPKGYSDTYGFSHGYNAAISFTAAEDFIGEGMGTTIQFSNTPNGDTHRIERMRIDQNGNIGIGTSSPQSALQVVGYVQLDLTDGSPPPAEDCDDPSEYGRMMVDQINEDVYVCVVSGWKTLKGKK